MKQTMQERFDAKVDKAPGHGPQGECWIWTAQTNNKGYGRFATGKFTKVLAHRMAYQLAKGVIPEGQVIRHSCDTPACVNPAHLSIGTHQQNVADMFDKGRQSHNLPGTSFAGGFCGRGHAMTADNIITNASGRRCRECAAMRKRLYRAGKSAADSK